MYSHICRQHLDIINSRKFLKIRSDYHPLGNILSPLAAAVMYLQIDIAELLVKHGANPTVTYSDDGRFVEDSSRDGMLYARMRRMTPLNLALFFLHEIKLVGYLVGLSESDWLTVLGKSEHDSIISHRHARMLPSFKVLSRLKQQGAKSDGLRHVEDQVKIAKKLVTVLNESPHTKKLRNTFALKVFLRRVVRVSKTIQATLFAIYCRDRTRTGRILFSLC